MEGRTALAWKLVAREARADILLDVARPLARSYLLHTRNLIHKFSNEPHPSEISANMALAALNVIHAVLRGLGGMACRIVLLKWHCHPGHS